MWSEQSVFLVAGVFLLSVVGSALAEDDAGKPRTISVIGQGEVIAAPDLAVLGLSVETTARTADEASRTNASRSSAVVGAIKGLSGKGDSLKTTGYTLQPRYGDRKPGGQTPPAIVGYVARNEVQAEIHDLEAVGKILDAALAAGANRASNLRFLVEDRKPHVRAALARAGAEARAQAESIADALGVRLGDVLSASTSTSPTPRPQQAMMSVRAAEAVGTPLEVGDVRIGATLHVSYGIK